MTHFLHKNVIDQINLMNIMLYWLVFSDVFYFIYSDILSRRKKSYMSVVFKNNIFNNIIVKLSHKNIYSQTIYENVAKKYCGRKKQNFCIFHTGTHYNIYIIIH